MNNLLYTSKTRGRYILKNTLWQKIRPSLEYTHLLQLPGVDKYIQGMLYF